MKDRGKAEQVLWNYCRNVKKAEELRAAARILASVSCQDYGLHAVNGVSEPVFRILRTKLALEKKISDLEKKIRAVEKVHAELPIDALKTYQMGKILEHRYINHKGVHRVMRELGITKTTYYRRNDELIGRVAECLGD